MCVHVINSVSEKSVVIQYLWSLVMENKNTRPENNSQSGLLNYMQGGHDHLRIIRHVLNRCAIPLRGRNPTILKQRRGDKGR